METLDDLEVQMLTGHTNLATNKIYRHPTNEIMLKRTRHLRDKLDTMRQVPSISQIDIEKSEQDTRKMTENTKKSDNSAIDADNHNG
jgi:hypothetical protein